MKAAIWKIDDWKESSFDNTAIKRVIFKGLDDNKSYYLNLNTKFPNEVNKWVPALKEGNVLEVNLQPNNKNINYFSNYILIKKV